MASNFNSPNSDRQSIGISNDEVFLPRRNVNSGTHPKQWRYLNRDQLLLGWLVGKVNAQLRLFAFRFPGGMKVRLHDNIASFGKESSKITWHSIGHRSWYISSQSSRHTFRDTFEHVAVSTQEVHAYKTRQSISTLLFFRISVYVYEEQSMMDNSTGCRTHLNRFDPTVLWFADGKNKRSILIWSVSRDRKRSIQFDDQVWFSKAPSILESGCGRN